MVLFRDNYSNVTLVDFRNDIVNALYRLKFL